ncbi:LysR family transcriptional regulator [Auritidibacter sp. NML100628]|uniref:LysR family transcriptional regulator n=1 Tax=Auritidibacter sp. NML100628 TaxID=2170742 RepID=UPI000D727AEF|nr:LysR family transcriptional regulator [Auritidibacter sp. NML100628]PXA77082.1 LysR family transcriptional regulator [Auritidibacter sp. NML100628]
MSESQSTLNPAHVQQLECLIVLSEELHFGRTADRLGYSQSRASQLIGQLECRIGARLVQRTSRRVSLTRLGEQFVKDVKPHYRGLITSITRARERMIRGALQELRVGFTGVVYEEITRVFRVLTERFGVSVRSHDLPLGSPFSSLSEHEVDAVIAELPVHDPDLVVGFRFPPQDQYLAVSSDHPFALRRSIDLEDLGEVDLLHREGDAPDYWKAARTPASTPEGRPILSTFGISSVQQGLTLTASGEYSMLVCRPLTEHNLRSDVSFVPVRGLEESSQLALVWRKDSGGPTLPALAGLLAEALMDGGAAAIPDTSTVVTS